MAIPAHANTNRFLKQEGIQQAEAKSEPEATAAVLTNEQVLSLNQMYPNVLQSICEFVSKSLLFRSFPNCQATPLSLQKVTLELVSTDLPATHGQHVMTTYKDRQAGKPLHYTVMDSTVCGARNKDCEIHWLFKIRRPWPGRRLGPALV